MSVSHAVELALDDAATQQIAVLLDRLDAAGITSIRSASLHAHPHVSITVTHDTTPDVVAAALDGVAPASPPAVSLASVGVFLAPVAVVFLGVVATTELLALNGHVHERCAARGVGTWSTYAPGAWVPHCTLAMRPPSVGAALEALGDASLPIPARGVALRVVEVPTGKVVATLR